MAARTAARVTPRRRLLGLAIRHVPAVARSLRGTPAAGTHVTRFPAGQQGLPLDVAVWTPPGHDRSATGSPVLVVLARHDGDWLPSTLAKDLRAVVVTMAPDDDAQALATLSWIASHAAGWNGTAERLGILGDGPGADRALRVTALARDAGGPAVLRLVLVSPSGDVPSPGSTDSRGRDRDGMPDALVHVGAADPRIDHVVEGVAALKAAGAKARLIRIPQADQGWLAYPAADPRLARRSLDEIVAYLRRGLTEERAFGVGPA
ncbi:alpha/beta hydrolase fold domain-containing protein [Clavibacter sp. VKM Ac-2873]|uniref:alpha/beta hydrolase n=1 Tax=Clavibacter sp. VKM Ac-2873 TaxID=2783813 RepID=UPI00188BA1CE|nr:alpha/beta hydrolase fold domain-containing protein [Clavibacter sp. VKM Ac-2873]MBF4618931.1 alpha/beta hydrolase fold domain-containing protein [Clavibacter sp. VKM Ac-2873]